MLALHGFVKAHHHRDIHNLSAHLTIFSAGVLGQPLQYLQIATDGDRMNHHLSVLIPAYHVLTDAVGVNHFTCGRLAVGQNEDGAIARNRSSAREAARAVARGSGAR